MDVWLARLRLNVKSREVRRDLRDAVALHRRVMSLLPDGLGDQARHKAGVLYRLDETRQGPTLTVQAGLLPSDEKLPEGYCEFAVRHLTPLLKALQPGMRVHYRIAANATKRAAKSDEKHKKGQIVALSGVAAGEWWQRQATTHGLTLVTSFAQPLPQARGEREDGKSVCHAVTRFDGTAIVRDPDLLREALVRGIGRGKSYGCGLLSLAPVRRPA